jgi:hypothetical protein
VRGEEKKKKGFVGKREGKKPLLQSRHRWEDSIKIDLKEIGWKTVDCSNLA